MSDRISRRGFVAAAAGVAGCATAVVAGDDTKPLQEPSGSRARIVTTCQNGRGHATVEGNREAMLALFERALKQQPDLVCFPEGFIGLGSKEWRPEPVPGPTTDAFARRAKANRCYVICPIPTAREGKAWNSAVVMDRSGEILGIYDKVHPVTSTSDYTGFETGPLAKDGLFPGGDPPVFDLDFGRIGIQICFDAGFPETWDALARQGVKAVFWPSAYEGGLVLQAYASLYHYYVITSVNLAHSRIIDPCGRVVAQTDGRVNFVVQDINLDFVVSHYDFNWGIPERIMDAYPGQVKITSYREDAHFIVEPTDPALTTKQLQAEFGFESASQYHQRHRDAHAALRAGKQPTPQKAAHGKRGQYSK